MNENARPRYASAYDGYSQNFFGLQGSLKSHLLPIPPPPHMSTGQVYPSLPEMSSLYQQHYLFGGNGYYMSNTSHSDHSQKLPVYMYSNRDYTTAYNQPFMVYSPMVRSYSNYPPGVYPSTEAQTPRGRGSHSKKGDQPMHHQQRPRRVPVVATEVSKWYLPL